MTKLKCPIGHWSNGLHVRLKFWPYMLTMVQWTTCETLFWAVHLNDGLMDHLWDVFLDHTFSRLWVVILNRPKSKLLAVILDRFMITVVGHNFVVSKVMIMNQYFEHCYRKVKFSSYNSQFSAKTLFFSSIHSTFIKMHWKEGYTCRQTNRQTDRNTDRQTNRHTLL